MPEEKPAQPAKQNWLKQAIGFLFMMGLRYAEKKYGDKFFDKIKE